MRRFVQFGTHERQFLSERWQQQHQQQHTLRREVNAKPENASLRLTQDARHPTLGLEGLFARCRMQSETDGVYQLETY